MNLSDAELRSMVRDAIARVQGSVGPEHGHPDEHLSLHAHPSHIRLTLVASGDPDGACVIEPSVRCTHCGYCQSYGH